MFRHVKSQEAELDGITIMGEVSVAPAAVARRFGPPAPGEGYKISGEYAFLNERNEAFVLHDWLSTKLYHPEGPDPEKFWAREEPTSLSISSLDLDVAEFSAWLKAELG